MAVTPLARSVLDQLVTGFGTAADGAKAGPMRGYMRDQFALLGIPTPQRRALFFIRKAIGWALRAYARTDPDSVRAFVQEHERALSPLSVRQALKSL